MTTRTLFACEEWNWVLAASMSLALSGCCEPQGLGVYEAELVPILQGCSQGEPLEVFPQTVEVEISEFNAQECSAKLAVRGPIVVRDAGVPTVYPLPAWDERVRDEGEGALAFANSEDVEIVYGGEDSGVHSLRVLERSVLGVWPKYGNFENLYRLQESGARFWFGTGFEFRSSQCFFFFDVELRRKS